MERTRGQNRIERRHSPNGTDTRTKLNGTEAQSECNRHEDKPNRTDEARLNETETNRTARERERKRERKRKRKKVLLIHKQVVACPSKRSHMHRLYTNSPTGLPTPATHCSLLLCLLFQSFLTISRVFISSPPCSMLRQGFVTLHGGAASLGATLCGGAASLGATLRGGAASLGAVVRRCAASLGATLRRGAASWVLC